ncbi:hypothetical protein AN618_08120 [Fervidicola ferrireducens]|jgi:soluble P-type ATPase|uniref:Soluble P-type ATPase n=1 Tax=Fervidicola ferrireducens TaxID=520764 RepID=A0A140LB75_9FIRM|nr:HAD family hydrolase [Fervidicola ferrireducens]KXG77800.1 hypothetical protein AN618_08120 [Fervidicola ferrireducens]
MLKIEIPGEGIAELKYLVLDYNGTLAADGKCSERVKELIKNISNVMEIYVLTADTYGCAYEEIKGLPVKFQRVDPLNGGEDKKNFVEKLGGEYVAAVGNGKNDVKMFQVSRLRVAVIGKEGAFFGALMNSDIVVTSPEDALELFLNTKRIVATLRK